MNRAGFEFDIVTQRFIENRWETDLGKKVYNGVIEGIKRGADVRSVLDPYVLDHPENSDPYGHPYYPVAAMKEGSFWVLTQDDLRGIHLYNEVFSENAWLGTKSLNYARFYNCHFRDANFERTSLTRTTFEKCNLENAVFAMAGGYNTNFINCVLKDACFFDASLIETDFSGSDLSGVYLENANLEMIKVNYNTKLDFSLTKIWKTRMLPSDQEPEILKAIRISYASSELWNIADKYLYMEMVANRKYILWPKAIADKNALSLTTWFKDYLWDFTAGYGVRPTRIWLVGLVISLFFSVVYFLAGNPGSNNGFTSSLYFSFTTFATLGYGDLTYPDSRWLMRLISTAEAWTGAVLISMFVAVMSRKVLRY
jgi:hypothetical protein